jgi:hypothetical protein
MFVKVKSHMLTNELTFSKKAAKYQQWQQQVRRYMGLLPAVGAVDTGHDQLAFAWTTHGLWCLGSMCWDWQGFRMRLWWAL